MVYGRMFVTGSAVVLSGDNSYVWLVIVFLVLITAVFILANNHFYKKHEKDKKEKEKGRII